MAKMESGMEQGQGGELLNFWGHEMLFVGARLPVGGVGSACCLLNGYLGSFVLLWLVQICVVLSGLGPRRVG